MARDTDRLDDQVTVTRTDRDAAEDDPNAIRAGIVDTRDRMSHTLDEIGERLNPQNVKAHVKDTIRETREHVTESIREATIGRVEHMARSAQHRVTETQHSIADTIRDNPIPAAMVGIGLGWLMWNGRKDDDDNSRRPTSLNRPPYDSSPYRSSAAYGATGGEAYGDAGYRGTAGYARPDYDSPTERARGELDDEGTSAAERARERLSHAGDSAREGAHQLADRAHEQFDSMSERAGELKDTVADQTRRQARRVEDTFYENPLAIAAVTMALGVAAGMSVPATHKESKLMGGARDQFVDRAREVMHDTRDKAKHVAERVASETSETVKEAARDEGLTA